MRFRISSTALFLCAITIFLSSVVAAPLTDEQRAGLDLGMDKNYALIAIGDDNTPNFAWNSGPIAGSILMGQGENASFSGGGNGGLSNGGVLYYDNTVTGTNTFNSVQNPPPTQLVPTSTTENARTIAKNVSVYASQLGQNPNQTFGDITTDTTITGNGGLNVIDFDNLHDAGLTLDGDASDYFVFNVSGQIHTNRAMTLSGGVSADHVLFNLTGTGNVLFQTAGGDISYGTYLATNGGSFQFSNLELTGELINIGGEIQFVSGSEIPSFVPFNSVPEPSIVGLLTAGIILCAGIARRR